MKLIQLLNPHSYPKILGEINLVDLEGDYMGTERRVVLDLELDQMEEEEA
ncbi:MAG: hypothetical protein ACE5KO_04275 [Candidatus Bathyarchaeia archaeon]